MGIVIDINTRRDVKTSTIGYNIRGVPVQAPKTRDQYLSICKQFLTADQYRQILCAIFDKEIYDAAHEKIQCVVDCYYSFQR